MKTNTLPKLACLALALGLAGCAGIPADQRPLAMRNVAAELPSSIKLAREGWPEARWWTAYGDYQLNALIDHALVKGPTLDVAEARIASARSAVNRANAELGLETGLNAGLTRQRYSANGLLPPPIGGSWITEESVTVEARYHFDWWGRNKAQIEAAVGEVNARRASYAAAEQDLAAAIAGHYFTLQGLWARRAEISPATQGAEREAIEAALELLDSGKARVAEPDGQGGWKVNQWLKQAVLLSFRLEDSAPMEVGLGAYDKVPLKFADWGENRFREAGFRAVPGAVVRRSAFIAKGVVLMPSFVNLGAYVDENTMVDTWATIGSCAQIGKNCHISGGAGIGGVLEPLQANPVVIGDNCFVGARSEVAEGVIVGEGSVLSMGVFLGASTKIVDRATGEVFMGHVPPYSVVVPGSLPGKPLPDGTPGPSLYCAVIVKRVDAQTRSKTSINELLRD